MENWGVYYFVSSASSVKREKQQNLQRPRDPSTIFGPLLDSLYLWASVSMLYFS